MSYGSSEVLGGLLASLPAACTHAYVGVVADNLGEDPVHTMAVAAGLNYLALDNHGYGSAVNSAVNILPDSIEWLVVTNPDVTFRAGAIDLLISAAESDPRIGDVGPKIFDKNGSVYPSARAIPSLRNGIGHALFGRFWPSNPWTARYLRYDLSDATEARSVGWLSGACLLVRKSAFDEVSGFDESYFMYFEDVDLGYRLSSAGYLNVYHPLAEIVHTGAHSTEGESKRMIDEHHKSARLFISRKYPGRSLAPLRLLLGIGLYLRSLIEQLSNRA